MHHTELAKATQTRIVLLDDLRENLRNHAILHQDIARALGVSPAGDLESFDLTDKASWVSWHFLNSADHVRFMSAAGL